MPAPTRLPQPFYDCLSERVPKELLCWLLRFDAKLEQRVATLEANLKEAMALLEPKLEHRLGEQSR